MQAHNWPRPGFSNDKFLLSFSPIRADAPSRPGKPQATQRKCGNHFFAFADVPDAAVTIFIVTEGAATSSGS